MDYSVSYAEIFGTFLVVLSCILALVTILIWTLYRYGPNPPKPPLGLSERDREFCRRFEEAAGKMAEVGLRWLDGEHDEFESLEQAMLSVEPGASGSLYNYAMHKVREGRLLQRRAK